MIPLKNQWTPISITEDYYYMINPKNRFLYVDGNKAGSNKNVKSGLDFTEDSRKWYLTYYLTSTGKFFTLKSALDENYYVNVKGNEIIIS